jgi:hypothetical protein
MAGRQLVPYIACQIDCELWWDMSRNTTIAACFLLFITLNIICRYWLPGHGKGQPTTTFWTCIPQLFPCQEWQG